MSSQSLVSDFVASLQSAQKNLYRFGGPILIGIGTMSCILSLIVFNKKHLRKNPCSIYLTAFYVANFLLIYLSILSATLLMGYDISLTAYNLSFCRFTVYMAILLDILSPSYLILASFDRILVTSPNAGTRRRSTQRLAYICIISVTIFWMLFHSHAFILVNIVQLAPNYFSCYFESGVDLVFIAYYTLIKAILVPLIMAIFGLWTMKNIRSMRRVRAAPVFSTTGTAAPGGLHSAHSKDRQLVHILLIDISVYIIFTLMSPIVAMYQQITQYNVKSLDQIQMDIFLTYFSVFIAYIPFCTGCYTNSFVSKTFRNELKNALLCK